MNLSDMPERLRKSVLAAMQKEEDERARRKAVAACGTTVRLADMESTLSVPSVAEKEYQRLDSCRRVDLLFVSRRHRLADPDGLSAKAAIDGLVLAKVLSNDSSEFVKEVRHLQEKASKDQMEETIIEIREAI